MALRVLAIETDRLRLRLIGYQAASSEVKTLRVLATETKAETDRLPGVSWTEEEHNYFLWELEKLGKGDSRGISRNFVTTMTPTQVAAPCSEILSQTNQSQQNKA
ncbi:transcription factor MYBS3-like [Zingiber officinale]|uniref:transcription factor MYBS3-like n=1 Tax=Zingiber officinale TaxID=94328 RepID=UPI001C4B1CDF|nr:transcription factor MYBS3-like [Zingiber officinale]